jgi:solute carrier family 25 phosphate transporter 23/24/25/41
MRMLSPPRVACTRKEECLHEDGTVQAPSERKLSAGEATVRKLLAGGLAGAVSKSCVAPLERLTTIMMADAPGQGLVKSVKHMWCDGGLVGMWSGNAATLAKIFPQTAIQFAAFHTLKEVVSAKYAVSCRP